MPKLQSSISVESLEPLIEELTKSKPNNAKIKKMMNDHGLEYTSDPIQQMSSVLSLMSHLPSTHRNKKRSDEVGL